MEELKVKGIDELCEWLEGQPEMKGKYDILEPACKVIREQKIYGDAFITYTWEKWKAEGLPGGVAETLVQIVERVTKESGNEKEAAKPYFQASEEQLEECYAELDGSDLKDWVEMLDDKRFIEDHHTLHTHRIGRGLHSQASVELRDLYFGGYPTTMLIGVSGCGKSHAIYLNALTRPCIYLTPNSWILREFYRNCEEIRHKYDFDEEKKYRSAIQSIFFKYLCARYVVLMYLKSKCGDLSNELLFFFQCARVLDKTDSFVYGSISSKYRGIAEGEGMEKMLTDWFIAIDEAQQYFTSKCDILNRTDVSTKQPISFARFFSWCSPILGSPVVISGTALRLKDMDRLCSGNRSLEDSGIKVHHEFDNLDCSRVQKIVTDLVGSIEDDLLHRIGYLLQGRPRILMNFIEILKRTNQRPEAYFETYIQTMIENGENDVWSLYGLWKDLFEDVAKKQSKVNLRLRNSESAIDCDIQTCFLKILMDSIRLLDDNDIDDEKMSPGSWFYLTSNEFDNVSTGLCPLVSIAKHKYQFMEPLSMFAGLHYVLSTPTLRPECFKQLLDAMFAKGTTEQVCGSYFDLFVAMKIAVDGGFRRRLFDMAVETGRQNEQTQWILGMTLPDKDYFNLKCKASDDIFVRSLENDSHDVILPSKLAGPDVKWWIFLFGLKTTWTKPVVGANESSKNGKTVTPSLCFDWRSDKNNGEPLPKKRKVRNEECIKIADSKTRGSCGFIRVRIELPSSDFKRIEYDSTNDIHLDIDWMKFKTLLSTDEADRFTMSFK